MTAFIIVLTTLNLVLWGILLIRFKKIFTTDSIIEKTRDQLNKMIADIDKATDRDMFLSSEATKRIQAKIDDADKKIEMFSEATNRLRDMIAEADRINKLSNNKSSLYNNISEPKKQAPKKANPVSKANIDKYLQNSTNSSWQNPSNSIDPDSYVQLKPSAQGDLFDQEPEPAKIIKDEITVTQDGAAYKEVPLIITKIYEDSETEEPVEKVEVKKNLREQVQELYEEGMKAEDIALHLSCSITEVQFIIDMI